MSTVKGRLILKAAGSNAGMSAAMAQRRFRYNYVALGGTFDVFHKGHEQLITRAFELARRVLIGVTGDAYVKRYRKNHPVQPFSTRVKALRRFLSTRGWSARATIVRLQDPYGPPAWRKDIEALVITPDTAKNATKLNGLRANRGLQQLKIHKIPLFRAADGEVISSTRIRMGEVDREGRLIGM